MLNRIKEGVFQFGEDYFMHYQTDKYPYPPIFIVGFIRSGTTIVYQYLNACYKFAYFPNVARHQNHKHPFLSTWLHSCHKQYTSSFDNEYGHIEGKCAPSDGWEIFHRWFCYNMKPGTTRDLVELKKLVTAFEKLYQAPFLNKNNSNTLRLIELSKTFPNAVFIYVHREIYSNITSVIKARKKHGVPIDKFWGVAPDLSLLDTNFESELDVVVFQYLFCKKFVKKVCDKLSINFVDIDYNLFCEYPQNLNWNLERVYPKVSLKARKGIEGNNVIKKKGKVQRQFEIDESIEKVQHTVELALEKALKQFNI